MKKVTVSERLAGLDPAMPDMIGMIVADGAAMIGLAHIVAGSTDHFWEKHGGGDEVLYLLEGEATFTSVSEDGESRSTQVHAGDLLILSRNEAHQARITKNLRLIFVTPEDGNEAWTDDPDVSPRH